MGTPDLAPLPITLDSPYLKLGNYTEAAWEATLLPNSPLHTDLAAIVQASSGVGILAREGALKESSDGTDQSARQAHNPLGLMVRSESEPYIVVGSGRKLRVFTSWAAAFAEHKRRLTDPSEAYLSVGVRTLGEFIERYLMGWKPNDTNHPLPPGETIESLRLYQRQFVERINGRITEYGRAGSAPPPSPPPPGGGLPQGFRSWSIAGLPGPLIIPDTITIKVIWTPVGVHRPGRVVTMTGSTLHETGNRGNGAGAIMHSNWQDGCTQGHPDGYVGVSMYVENRLVVIKIPLNENSIHSGDWRNNAHPSMEVCVNADRNAAQTEDTAMWVQAAMLLARQQNALDSLYPHHPVGCPAIINGEGRWPQIESGTDERIAVLKQGGSVPPPTEYPDPDPIPKVWDGTDYKRDDGHMFLCLSRVFVARKVTAARKFADPQSPKVRRDLPAGEAFLSHYVTRGTDNQMWIVSQFGSRIAAQDCAPDLNFLTDDTLADRPTWEADFVLNDPSRGLSAADVPDDAPTMSKAEFMRG